MIQQWVILLLRCHLNVALLHITVVSALKLNLPQSCHFLDLVLPFPTMVQSPPPASPPTHPTPSPRAPCPAEPRARRSAASPQPPRKPLAAAPRCRAPPAAGPGPGPGQILTFECHNIGSLTKADLKGKKEVVIQTSLWFPKILGESNS